MNVEGIESLKINFINHKEITNTFLKKIVLIKEQQWEYSKEEQLRWISENLLSDDKHLMIFNKDNALIAYMNMVNVKIQIEKINYEVLGIGNVCIDNKYFGKGMGKLLMNVCELYLKNLNKTGILLCKDKLNSFYEKIGWIKYKNKVLINKEEFNHNVFFSDNRYIYAAKISIDRLF